MDSIDSIYSESDSDVVFDKNMIFSAFCSKCCFIMELNHIYTVYEEFRCKSL